MTFFATLNRVVVVFLLILSYKSYGDEQQESCSQRCGVHNITHPFRLKNSPKHCGDERYILSCENNNQLILYYKPFGKYYVQSINYNNFTIRLLDFNHSSYSVPPHPLGSYNFTSHNSITSLYQVYGDRFKSLVKPILYVNCPNRVQYSSDIYFPAPTCINISDSYPQHGNFSIKFGYQKSLSRLGLEDGCRIEFMYLTSWDLQDGNNSNISCTDIRRMMLYGFELSWSNIPCKDGSVLYFDENTNVICPQNDGFWLSLAYIVQILLFYTAQTLALLGGVKFVFGTPFIIVLLVYKWRQKHLSVYDNVEDFLQSDNNIMPIRYSYRDIKKMTKQFKIKLGHGGYGSVFKGELRSGRLVAVKLLDRGKTNGQDFMNEVSTIGRIHHVSVVQLIGFCVEGSKRALIYEFMPNGSLEKYIFSSQESYPLSCEKLYNVSFGVARGIEYLHNGCNMKILHFDIKPHNILLDENFNPKISDFGLARFYPTDKSIVTLTAVRGTIGYMAPELFYRNVGAVSYKADVYSFGMLLMEMASRRKNLNAVTEKSSQIYFPFWIYDQLHDGKEVTIENDTDEEMKLAKKMMIVALWCIQTKPEDRPCMIKVLEMLEEEDGELQIPNKPYFCLQDQPVANVTDDSVSSS
ncbi:unnamed protein product [Lathyrus oleraceus]